MSSASEAKKPKLDLGNCAEVEVIEILPSASGSGSRNRSSSNFALSGSGSQIRSKIACTHGVSCYRKNPHHFREFSHPQLEALLQRIVASCDSLEDFSKYPELSSVFPNQENLFDQLTILKQLGFHKVTPQAESESIIPSEQVAEAATSSFQCNSSKNNSNRDNGASLTGSPQKHSTAAGASALKKQNVLQREMQAPGDMLSKWENSSPYNYFLTRLSCEQDSDYVVSFRDIFHPSLGIVKEICHFNFMVEFEWFLEETIAAGLEGKNITIIYGTQTTEMQNAPVAFPWITTYHIKSPFPFGHHHTKMILIKYEDDSLRFVIHTANLIESDWDKRTQGVWISPRCCPMNPAQSSAGESVASFRSDIIQYLSTYPPKHVTPWINAIRNSNCSHIKVVFIGSAPVTLASSSNGFQWGQKKVEKHLKTCSNQVVKANWPLIIQCSSIGTLGQSDDWLRNEIGVHMCPISTSGLMTTSSKIPIHVVYPSHANVLASYDGINGGGCLPYSCSTHMKQPWFQNYLYKWKSDLFGRTRAVPHIKTYCRVSPDYNQLAWFILTSANLSKAAWGKLNKARDKLSVMSWEVGVLFIPKYFDSSDFFEIAKRKDIEASSSSSVPFRLPFDMPDTKYGDKERPWFIECLLAQEGENEESD